MKKNIQLKITVTLLFFIVIFTSNAQISQSQQQVIEEYGWDFQEGIFEGNPYLLYTNPVTTKTSGFFIQQKVIFFKKANNGNLYCYMFQLLEPGSELKVNIDIYNRDIQQVGYLHWVDPADGINYRIDQPEGFCLITGWISDENPGFLKLPFSK